MASSLTAPDFEKICGELDKSIHQQDVEKFLIGIGHPIPDTPQPASRDRLLLYGRILLEEAFEYLEAAGVSVFHMYATDEEICFKDLDFRNDMTKEPDLVEIADGLADVQVISTGGLSLCGIKDLPLLDCVDANNLLKLANGYKHPETGKFIKPHDHPRPEIEEVLAKQGWEKPG